MKTLFKVVALAAFALCATLTDTKAQSYGFANFDLSGTPTTAAATTTTLTNLFIDCRNMQNVTLQTVFVMSASSTTNIIYKIAKSIDKVNFETVPSISWTNTANGTTPVVATTTIATGGAGWMKLVSVQNLDSSAVLTNTSFGYGIKVRAP